ncbi:hypothetical protein [Paenibacillus sp. FSL R7-0337]|uniref:hypothetical protein n=1 Tax=Paenibacillus sp. FSL R7-0337 TaxID=1926588 RepID=UPI00096C17A1|nr:hypothetical protein [Paenibacillus sp. FSL R7-0337]OMF84827.1 hypothetical protein BK147_32805 [Paenibacillus sp. FSL R7-0337]
MTALKTLVKLEYSRYRLKKVHELLAGLALLAVLLPAGLFFPLSGITPQSPFLTAAMLLWIIAMGVSSIHMISFYGQRHKDWFLTFPAPRLTLLQAKALSLLKLSLRIAVPIFTAAAVLYGLSVLSGRYEPLSAFGFIYTLIAYSFLILTLLPLAIMSGLLVSVLMAIRSQALLLLLAFPYSLLWLAPIITAILLNDNATAAAFYESEYLSTQYMLIYSVILLILDLSAYYFLLPVIANKSFSMLPQPESKLAEGSPPSYTKPRGLARSARSTSSRSPLLSLYRLDASLLRSMERHRLVIGLKLTLPVLMAVAAYFLSGDLEAFLTFIGLPFALPVLFGFLWMMIRSSSSHKQLAWWLLFPHSRLRLLLSGVAAVWVTVMRILLVLFCSMLAGIAATQVIGSPAPYHISLYISWLWYSLVVYTLALTLGLGVLQSIYYLMRSKALLPLIFVMTMAVMLILPQISKYLYPEEFTSAPYPLWSIPGLAALIGLPLAMCCTVAGAKYFHLALGTNKEQAAKKQA